jgi:hypothetical protein
MPGRGSSGRTFGRTVRSVGNRQIFPGVVAGVIRHSLSDPTVVRPRLLRYVWIELKRFGATNVRNIELSRIRGIESIRVEGPVVRHGMLVLSALAGLLESETIFTFGRLLDDTAWLIAHNLPAARVYTLELPRPATAARGERLPAPPEMAQIKHLQGEAGSFDFAPYSGTVDLVYIDGSPDSGSLPAQTDAAFGMLSELGCIVWDAYTYDAGVYDFLNRLAPELDRPIFHILGTRLALYSRWDIVVPQE